MGKIHYNKLQTNKPKLFNWLSTTLLCVCIFSFILWVWSLASLGHKILLLEDKLEKSENAVNAWRVLNKMGIEIVNEVKRDKEFYESQYKKCNQKPKVTYSYIE